VAAVENFDRGHGQTLVIREGQSIKFRSAYEFVWFHGTGGTAETALTVRLESAENKAPLASDEGTFPGDGSSYRVAGTLQTEVPFDEAGTYAVLATVRTRVDLNGSNEDEDTVRVRVLVIGEPEVGAISGCVTSDADDTPLAHVAMRIYGLDNRLYKVVYTGDDGTYKASGLQPGRYLVKADPLGQNYLAEWYDDAPTREEADPVTVVAGETTEEIDLALTPGGVIAGSVIEDSESNPGAITPLANVIVTAGSFETDEVMARTRTLEDGSYRLEKLPAGTYWVHAGNEAQSLIGEYYDDHLLREDADPVEVAEGGVVKRINFALQYGGGIAGRVIGVSTDDQLVPFKVTAYDWEPNKAVRTVGVGPGGRYRIPSLPVGGYRVYAFDEAGRYIPEYYDDVTDPDEATKVVVKRGATALGIDFVLRPVGTPTVAVRPEVTHVKPGDTFSITIGAEGVMDLGGYESDLSFNPQVIHAETVVDGGFLGSTGRKVVVMEPDIDNVNGLVSFGAVSTGDVPGPNGAGPLAIITFEAIASGDSELRLQGVQLTDTDGNPITCRTRNGKVVVAECIFGDFDCDCDVDIYDIMQVATRWGSEEGDPDYDPTYDVDDDGDIDIVDVAMVAAAWGNTCTDEAPGGALSAQGGDRALKRPKMLSTGLRLVPSPANGQVSQPLELEVVIDEAVDLGGFEFALQYDAARLSVDEEDVALDEFLGSTGRAPMPMEPQVTVDGGVGTVSFGAMTLGTTPPGPNGSGTLATITFTPLLAGEAGVSFANGQVTDTTGQPGESLALQGATLQIEATGDAFMPLVKKLPRGDGRAPRK
jgi:hypothetical protein